MKNYFRVHRNDLIFIAASGAFLIVSVIYGSFTGKTVLHNFTNSLKEMAVLLPLIFILIGLVDVWVPRTLIERRIGKDTGITGIVWVVLFAMLQAGPLYGAFPVAYIIWKKGASVRNVFIYLGAFSTMKIPMLSFEVGFLGWKFSLMRTLISLPVFIIIAFIMERMFQRDFKINSPGDRG